MRKINRILSGLLVISLGFAGCSNEEPLNSEGSTITTPGVLGTGNPVAFNATLSSKADNEIKKLAYGELSDDKTAINWTAGDRIRVYSSGDGVSIEGVYVTDAAETPATFAYVNEAGSSEITWANSFSPVQQFQAFCPANKPEDEAITGFPNGKAQFTVPAKQYPRDENGMGMDNALLLYAATSAESETDNISFQFDNVVTVLELTVPVSLDGRGKEVVIERIEVSAKGANADKLAGTFTAKTAGANPVTDFSTATFDVANPKSVVTVYPPATDWKSGKLYITLAPYAYDQLAITLISTDGEHRIARVLSKEGTNIVAGRKLYPINNALRWTEDVIDLGLLVKSVPGTGAAAGAVVTKVIGTFDGSLAWIVNEDGSVDSENIYTSSTGITAATVLANYGATPLYFATGNLLMVDGVGIIRPTYANTYVGTDNNGTDGYGQDALNKGFYQWGVPNGTWNGAQPADILYISGSQYDIAHVQLARLAGDWRLPTAVELSFLMELNAASLYTSWTDGYSASNGLHSGNYNNAIFTLTGVNGSKIFLPAAGNIQGTGAYDNKGFGYYLTGERGSLDYPRHVYFSNGSINSWWHIDGIPLGVGLAIRPVSNTPQYPPL